MTTRIKVCGLTREQDVAAAVAHGADYCGFILASGSPRGIGVARARELAATLPPGVTPVLVVVNPTEEQAAEIAQRFANLPLIVQFHGQESPERCAEVAAHLRRPWWRAVPVPAERQDPAALTQALLDYAARYPQAEAMLLDSQVAASPGQAQQFGGTGHAFDWHSVQWSRITQNAAFHLVLSGGLNAANVADGMRQAKPWALDVSSGVEARDASGKPLKGIKEAQAIADFCNAVRAADLG
jgi:phosphoribosylanthranilate isomerase